MLLHGSCHTGMETVQIDGQRIGEHRLDGNLSLRQVHRTIASMLPIPALILASGSQRRQRFLTDLGLSFQVIVADVDETPHKDENPTAMTCRLAETKAQAVAAQLPADVRPHLIIASDTTVALGDTIYGKPVDSADAARMLQDLRGRAHDVISALCLLHTPDGRMTTRTSRTIVAMRNYTDAEIAAYVVTGDPMDKAGAYGIQSRDFNCARSVEGCYATVMGMPLKDLQAMLAAYGVVVPVPVVEVCGRFNPFSCCAVRPGATDDRTAHPS